ncbi:MAG TPA: ATP phosphoribosyltransferase [Bacteroidales bacterium]|nr:ATP phosphoribosyltransferase [Bacteroidales bacterium]HPO66039.1 ATP phosphoribosyltransferase [Bacteroidales bacterium]
MEKLRVALQKSGRLSEKSIELLEECGVTLDGGPGRLLVSSPDFPVEVLYLRDDDIPQYVADGVTDVGIVGENVYVEKEKPVNIAERLGFSRCRLSLAVPKSIEYEGLQYFNNKKIATSYPNILSHFLKENNIQAEIHEISGSVEIAPGIGLADAIFDIVSSGSTLFSNNLKEVEVVMKSEAVLIAHPKLQPEKQHILEELIFRIRSVQKAKKHKYILLNAPNDKIQEIIELIPGMKSPSIVPLAKEGWSSLHSVVPEKDFWQIIGKLKEKGAQGILVIPIEKMIV